MHRWFGSSQDSEKQAAERDQRQARRILKQQQQQLLTLESSSEDEDYAECDLSTSFIPIVDGAGDDDDMSAAELAAELTRQRGLPVEEADFENDADSWKK